MAFGYDCYSDTLVIAHDSGVHSYSHNFYFYLSKAKRRGASVLDVASTSLLVEVRDIRDTTCVATSRIGGLFFLGGKDHMALGYDFRQGAPVCKLFTAHTEMNGLSFR